jgi:bifunctional DNA-binding transcriptional regulator/antitoxin component of YhaV-PrlF toxin-antitoxin module
MSEEENWSPIFTAMVERGYRIVIPSTIRKILRVEEGDVLEVKVRKVKGKWKILRE